jgi:hypothetical protein
VTKEEIDALTEGDPGEEKGIELDLGDLEEAVGGRFGFFKIFNRK